MLWMNLHQLRLLEVHPHPTFQLTFDFFPRKFADCSKPLSKDNHRKQSYPRTQHCDQGEG